MELSHLGIALITFMLIITLHKTESLIEDHLQNQSVNSITFNHPSFNTKKYSTDSDHKNNDDLKYYSYPKEYPCNYF